MKIIHSEKRLCTCCMEQHEVKTVQLEEHTMFKHTPITYTAVYFYCDNAEELFMDEEMIQKNDLAMKDAYRKAVGLLTSVEIRSLRQKYDISQQDLCTLLGWGMKTITRYETHQVQDRAHDTILKKLDQDPEWFLHLLAESNHLLSPESCRKYASSATLLFDRQRDSYLRKSIEAKYAKFGKNPLFHGNTPLSLDKVIDVIRYFSSVPKVTSLYKVKLMKLLWYSDALSYKRTGHALTGLVYQALPMGAVPIGHSTMIFLQGVPCEELEIGDGTAYHFTLKEPVDFPFLTDADKEILDTVIRRLGSMTTDEIVSFMHQEQAYLNTAPREIISYEYAKNLQI